MEQSVHGMGGNIFFFGVVENICDPEKLGRVKVRIVGDHTQNKSEIPTEHLPWAMPIMPITTASMNGIGQAPIGLVQGSWVVGFYRDGAEKQQPIIMGSIGGIPLDTSTSTVGFNDPIGCFPQSEKLGEPDTNRLARGTVGKHVIEPDSVTIRRDNTLKDIATATMQWSEPETPYAPVYPYNYSWEGTYNESCDGCSWGHIEEWDSTPGSERYFRQHKTSQNFLEIHPDGKEVRKIYGDGFEIDLASKHLYVSGDYRVTVEGNKDEHIKGDYWQHIKGDFIQVVDGNKNKIVKGTDSTTVYNDIVRRATGSIIDATENKCIRIANDGINDASGGQISVISATDHTSGVGSYENLSISAFSNDSVQSEGYNGIVLSCSVANGNKVTLDDSIIPNLLSYTTSASAAENTQLKIKTNYIYLNSTQTHASGELFVYDVCNFNSDTFIGGDLDVEDSIKTGASVSVGTSLFAEEPKAFDTQGSHFYIVPTPGQAPSSGGATEFPASTEISESVTIESANYEVSIIDSSQDAPGEIHKCK